MTVTENKRGRGRPRLDNALTPAERAKRYRDRKKAAKRRAAAFPNGFYRGPHGQTWSGRGLMPRWLAVLVREGIDKSLYLVKS